MVKELRFKKIASFGEYPPMEWWECLVKYKNDRKLTFRYLIPLLPVEVSIYSPTRLERGPSPCIWGLKINNISWEDILEGYLVGKFRIE